MWVLLLPVWVRVPAPAQRPWARRAGRQLPARPGRISALLLPRLPACSLNYSCLLSRLFCFLLFVRLTRATWPNERRHRRETCHNRAWQVWIKAKRRSLKERVAKRDERRSSETPPKEGNHWRQATCEVVHDAVVCGGGGSWCVFDVRVWRTGAMSVAGPAPAGSRTSPVRRSIHSLSYLLYFSSYLVFSANHLVHLHHAMYYAHIYCVLQLLQIQYMRVECMSRAIVKYLLNVPPNLGRRVEGLETHL